MFSRFRPIKYFHNSVSVLPKPSSFEVVVSKNLDTLSFQNPNSIQPFGKRFRSIKDSSISLP